MAAPKGNQYAKNPQNHGRPIEYDIEDEAKEIIKWSKKPKSIHLAEFAISRGYSAPKLYLWRDRHEVFREALIIAKDQLAIRIREGINSKTYNERLGMRDVTSHDSLLKIDERDDMAYASQLKIKQDQAAAHTLAELNQLSKNGDLSQK